MFKGQRRHTTLGYLLGLLLFIALAEYFGPAFSFSGWRPHLFFSTQGISRILLCTAMPALSWADEENEFVQGPVTASLTKLLSPLQFDIRNPLSVLRLEMPVAARVGVAGESAIAVNNSPLSLALPEESSAPAHSLAGDAQVIIYHTHTGETYKLTDGLERLEGKCGGVVQAGKAMQEALENKYGLKVAYSEKVHDAKYAVSYQESEKTLSKLLAGNPKAKVVLDIHRDAGKSRQDSLAEINGRKAAKILLIVGSDARLPFPNKKENLNFANAIKDGLDKRYPGLCSGVRIKDGRYNQFLHPRAVLVEIGSVNNTTIEAEFSACLMADCLGEAIQEMITEGE